MAYATAIGLLCGAPGLLLLNPSLLIPMQASLSGSLWGKALLGQRAQRIEMLLLHEFYDKKFLLPDKLSNKVGLRRAGND